MTYELTEGKYLHPEEIQKLASYLEGEWYKGLAKGLRLPCRNAIAFLFAIQTGVRASELTNIKHSDIELGNRPKVIIRHGKGNKSRSIPLNSSLKELLKEWVDNSKEWSSKWLFPNRSGNQWARNSAWQSWTNILDQIDLRHVPLHSTRHSTGLRLYRETQNLRLVQKVLGHSNINTTTIYADVLEDDIYDAMNRTELPICSVQQSNSTKKS